MTSVALVFDSNCMLSVAKEMGACCGNRIRRRSYTLLGYSMRELEILSRAEAVDILRRLSTG
ncbi:MAG: hypothetical protein FGF52_00675 [Candidatus Brockarchaeota archaeon]|nr:hypothetical protein [Candidatus Brockarchaeota archaeon]